MDTSLLPALDHYHAYTVGLAREKSVELERLEATLETLEARSPFPRLVPDLEALIALSSSRSSATEKRHAWKQIQPLLACISTSPTSFLRTNPSEFLTRSANADSSTNAEDRQKLNVSLNQWTRDITNTSQTGYDPECRTLSEDNDVPDLLSRWLQSSPAVTPSSHNLCTMQLLHGELKRLLDRVKREYSTLPVSQTYLVHPHVWDTPIDRHISGASTAWCDIVRAHMIDGTRVYGCLGLAQADEGSGDETDIVWWAYSADPVQQVISFYDCGSRLSNSQQAAQDQLDTIFQDMQPHEDAGQKNGRVETDTAWSFVVECLYRLSDTAVARFPNPSGALASHALHVSLNALPLRTKALWMGTEGLGGGTVIEPAALERLHIRHLQMISAGQTESREFWSLAGAGRLIPIGVPESPQSEGIKLLVV